MNIDVIGGGPAGLYFAILAKKSFPLSEIRVHERNRADDTFGFGVVFSDATLDNFERADKESYEAITNRFGHSHIAFLIVPMTGAFFMDIVNAIVIKLFLALPFFH